MPQELHHLPTHLQLAQVTVEVEPVRALQIEAHVPVEHIVDLTGLTRTRRDAMTTSARACTHPHRIDYPGTPLGGVRRSLLGWAVFRVAVAR